ncbi:MAG TPA: isoprenylcysteine carboxylmethyltransferase family protein [Candidatus Acidoferrales bacterium]|jgi:protein-S-isoprenylcysteine O-methyltransferase Ste14|nr:isoprenylcysteine carboxylmethyltransferase family protein [Candidatus Acidoferrales bacterium]
MRWRVRVGYPVAVIFWLLAAPTPGSILLGAIVAAVGLFIRGAASGYLRKYEELCTTGPYARTRNPLYFGSAILAAGFVVAGRTWWGGAIVAIYFALFYYAVMRNEESDLRARYGAAFEEYAARVPLFFPRVRITGAPNAAQAPQRVFSARQYKRNREYQALIGAIAGLGIMWLRMWLRRRFGY